MRNDTDNTTNGEPLLLTARQAAALLNVSEKTLWSHSHPRGSIPCVRMGKTVRYSRAELDRWIVQQCRGADVAENG